MTSSCIPWGDGRPQQLQSCSGPGYLRLDLCGPEVRAPLPFSCVMLLLVPVPLTMCMSVLVTGTLGIIPRTHNLEHPLHRCTCHRLQDQDGRGRPRLSIQDQGLRTWLSTNQRTRLSRILRTCVCYDDHARFGGKCRASRVLPPHLRYQLCVPHGTDRGDSAL